MKDKKKKVDKRTRAENWTAEIDELKKFFTTAPVPVGPVFLDKATKVLNVKKFIEVSIEIIESNNGITAFKPCLARLQRLKHIMSNFIQHDRLKAIILQPAE